MRKAALGLVAVAAFFAGCASAQDPVETVLVQVRSAMPAINLGVVQTFTSLDDSIHQGVQLRVENNAPSAYHVAVECQFIRGDMETLSENTVVFEMAPYTRRVTNVWSSRNSRWLYSVVCQVTDETHVL